MFAIALLACQLVVIDGDTLKCGSEHIRLLGIDAPELPGHCRKGRVCVAGDPYTSRDSLQAVIRSGPARIQRVGKDRYGRTLAEVWSGGRNLSCWQIKQRAAVYVARWDNDHLTAGACPIALN